MRAIAAGLGIVIFTLSAAFAGDAPSAVRAPPAASAPPPSSAAADAAAARHARRIACRKEAAGQKLTGEEKVEYIKECLKKPAGAQH